MRLVAAGLAQVLLVHLDDVGILVGLADGLGLVLSVQASGAGHARIDVHTGGGVHDGLTAAVDTAAGAGHDFHEVVGRFASLDLLDQLLGSAGGVGNGHLQVQVADGNLGFLHALDAAQSLVLHVLHALALQPVGRGAQGNPWLFAQAKAALEGVEIPALPPLRQRVDTAVRQIELAVADKGEHIAILEARKQYCWYLKGVSHANYYKEQIVRMNTLEDVYRITEGIKRDLV